MKLDIMNTKNRGLCLLDNKYLITGYNKFVMIWK